MTTPFADDTTHDADLRTLDAAVGTLTPAQEQRKAALLDEILTDDTGSVPGAHGGASGTPRPRRTAWRWMATAAGVAAVAGGLMVFGGGESRTAYASWTPDPHPVSGADLATAEKACRENMRGSMEHLGDQAAEHRTTVEPDTARTVVAERRGDFIFLAMATDDGSTTECFFDAGQPDKVQGSTGGWSTADTPPPARLAPGQVEVYGAGGASGPEGSYSFVRGRVANDVRGAVIRLPDGRAITATVANGSVAAWWPSSEAAASSSAGDLTIDVTTTGGHRIQDAENIAADHTPAPGPREIGRISTGGGAGGAGPVSTLEGAAGADVASVTVRVDGRTVQAPVTEGTFRAEWPTRASGEHGAVSYDLHLRDGSTLTDFTPPEPRD